MTNDDIIKNEPDEIQVSGMTSGRTESQTGRVQRRRNRRNPNDPKKGDIKIGRHGAEMIMTSNPEKNEEMLSQVSLPDGWVIPKTTEERIQVVKKLIAHSMGIAPNLTTNVPDRVGFNLTNQAERDVLFGVLKLMTDSDYKGTYQVPSTQVLKKEHNDNPKPVEAETKGYQLVGTQTQIGGAYENITSTPVLRIGQSELVRAVGYDPSISSDRERVAQAVVSLATKQNFLMWTRFSRDRKGKIERRNGRTRFEIVSTFSPVLNVNFISEPNQEGKPVLKYYEISLAPVFLDEVSREYGSKGDGYFLLIPQDANQEIEKAHRELFPYRVRVSPTIQALCYWLRLRVVEIQSKERNPFSKRKNDPELVVGYSDLCRRLNISETSFRRNPSRIRQLVEDGLRVAQKVGYISEFSSDDSEGEYRLVINFDYYPNRFRQGEETGEEPRQEETPREPEQGNLFG